MAWMKMNEYRMSKRTNQNHADYIRKLLAAECIAMIYCEEEANESEAAFENRENNFGCPFRIGFSAPAQDLQPSAISSVLEPQYNITTHPSKPRSINLSGSLWARRSAVTLTSRSCSLVHGAIIVRSSPLTRWQLLT
jgi:hypothetical protein